MDPYGSRFSPPRRLGQSQGALDLLALLAGGDAGAVGDDVRLHLCHAEPPWDFFVSQRPLYLGGTQITKLGALPSCARYM